MLERLAVNELCVFLERGEEILLGFWKRRYMRTEGRTFRQREGNGHVGVLLRRVDVHLGFWCDLDDERRAGAGDDARVAHGGRGCEV